MISRRDVFRAFPGLLVPAWLLHAQEESLSVFRADFNLVVLSFTVTDRFGRQINGLEANDMRFLEDGVPRSLSVFSESGKPPLRVRDDGSTSLLTENNGPAETGRRRLGLQDFEALRDRQEGSYTIAYRPDPSNGSPSFRKISIEVISDKVRHLRVKHQPGYQRTA